MKNIMQKILGFTATLFLIFANFFVVIQNNNGGIDVKLGQLTYASVDKGTLMENANNPGEFCCAEGTNDCGAAPCSC